MNNKKQPDLFIYNNSEEFISQLSTFIHFASVGAADRNDISACAAWLADHLNSIGMEHVRVIPTKKHPLLYADFLNAPGKPTLLIYGHYDVQPVDPLNEWHDHPFSGSVKDNYIYGRGASDDKGQLFVHIKALEYFLRNAGSVPVNVKCIFEGEEETGSAGLVQFLKAYPSLLQADVAVVSDMKIPGPLQPAITYSMRGALSVELEIKGQAQDLHSGNFGGVVYNPVQALCEIISKFHNTDGKITIPGFYKNVKPRGNNEIAYMKKYGTPCRVILKEAGTCCSWGEKGYSLYERISIRPSLSINGITGGYQDHGPKAVIPAKASAKLSFRLVPYQDPDEIFIIFKNFIRCITPPSLTCTIKKTATAKPFLTGVNNDYIKLASHAYRKVFKSKPVFIASGGTIPVVSILSEDLGIPVVLMGFALPNDNLHAPNERFYIPNFFNGIKTSIEFIRLLSNKMMVNNPVYHHQNI